MAQIIDMPHDFARPDIIETRVTSDDGVELFVRKESLPGRSQGVPIICCNGVGVSTVFWSYIAKGFRALHPVVTWDYRGHGRSGPPPDLGKLTIEQNADDLRAVLDALEIERGILLGHSMGCQVILEFERRYPDRTAALVPMLGTYGRPLDTFFESPIKTMLGFVAIHRIVCRFHERLNKGNAALLGNPTVRRLAAAMAKRAGIVDERMAEQKLLSYIHHMSVLDMRVFFRMVEKMAFHSVEDHLEQIAAPTLIVAGEFDYFTPLWLSEEMADRVPGAELVVIPRGSHAALVEQPELVHSVLESFLLRRLQTREPSAEACPPTVIGPADSGAAVDRHAVRP